MNSISVTHVSSSQLKSELGKKCCSTPKSLIQCGRWYPLLYCCFGFFFFFSYQVPFDDFSGSWLLQRKLSTIPLLERTGIYSQGSQIKSSRSQYRQCYITTVCQNSTGPWVAKDHSYLSGKRASLLHGVLSLCALPMTAGHVERAVSKVSASPHELHWALSALTSCNPTRQPYSFLTPPGTVFCCFLAHLWRSYLINKSRSSFFFLLSIIGKQSNAHKIYK